MLRSKLVLGVGDGWLKADGETIYRAKDLKVGLFQGDDAARRRLTGWPAVPATVRPSEWIEMRPE